MIIVCKILTVTARSIENFRNFDIIIDIFSGDFLFVVLFNCYNHSQENYFYKFFIKFTNCDQKQYFF